jgi:RNA polymerase sigma-54 factor
MMKPSLQLKLGQQLTMTPQLQQAIRLLQMPVLELNTQLQEALAENVMLELEEPVETATDTDNSSADDMAGELTAAAPEESSVSSRDAEDSNLWSDVGSGSGRGDTWSDDSQRPELADRSEETLREHLLWQLEMEHFTPREVVIGHAIVDSVNEDGYLTESLDDIQRILSGDAQFTLAEIEETLTKIQALDPIGIGARDLAECIRLQLGQLDDEEHGRDLAMAIAASHLELVAEHDYATLRRQLAVSDEDLDTALALVRSCHPRPGGAIQQSTAEYVIPDVYVRKQDGQWVVDVNRSVAPRLRVNQTYADLLRGNGEHATLRSQLQEARWLVRSLEIRNETLIKVAKCIIDRQIAFLEIGEEAMKPMVLRDIAEAVQMHESTISRVTANKYMHTPRGVIDFRYFFSSQLAGDDGASESSTAIRAKIRRLIGSENPQKPYSDNKLTALLADEGTKVARRTVAKYREAMQIAPSNERKHKPMR